MQIPERQEELRLFLVFERATQESLAKFLPGWYRDMDFIHSWDKTVSALASIGTGISSLHKHGVLHCDLHLQNILVTDRFYPNDPEIPHEFGFLITDIGEGKILHEGKTFVDLSDHVESYGAVYFRAPEVHGDHGWTTKAEVFSFGAIACKVFENRQNYCTAVPLPWILEQTHNNDRLVNVRLPITIEHIVPAGLREIIEPCFSHDPDARPTMREVVHRLDDLSLEFFVDKDEGETEEPLEIEWLYWNWEGSLEQGRSEPITESVETEEDAFRERVPWSLD